MTGVAERVRVDVGERVAQLERVRVRIGGRVKWVSYVRFAGSQVEAISFSSEAEAVLLTPRAAEVVRRSVAGRWL